MTCHVHGVSISCSLYPESNRRAVIREQYKKNVTQRITRMPRLCIPMKDVVSCDKLRSAARQALTAGDFRMGKPLLGYAKRPQIYLRRSHCELKHLSNSGKEINLEIP